MILSSQKCLKLSGWLLTSQSRNIRNRSSNWKMLEGNALSAQNDSVSTAWVLQANFHSKDWFDPFSILFVPSTRCAFFFTWCELHRSHAKLTSKWLKFVNFAAVNSLQNGTFSLKLFHFLHLWFTATNIWILHESGQQLLDTFPTELHGRVHCSDYFVGYFHGLAHKKFTINFCQFCPNFAGKFVTKPRLWLRNSSKSCCPDTN